MKVRKKMTLFLQGFILFHILWYGAAAVLQMKIIPKPTDIYLNLHRLYGDKLYIHIGMSLYRIGGGLGLALMIGIPIGLLMAYTKTWNRILYPLVYFTYPDPQDCAAAYLNAAFWTG